MQYVMQARVKNKRCNNQRSVQGPQLPKVGLFQHRKGRVSIQTGCEAGESSKQGTRTEPPTTHTYDTNSCTTHNGVWSLQGLSGLCIGIQCIFPPISWLSQHTHSLHPPRGTAEDAHHKTQITQMKENIYINTYINIKKFPIYLQVLKSLNICLVHFGAVKL